MDREIRLNDRVRIINPSDETKEDCPILSVGDEGIVYFKPIKLDPNDGKWKPCPGKCGVKWDKGLESSVERDEIEVL
jgi:hypothetical protein